MSSNTLHCFGSSTTLNFNQTTGLCDATQSWPHILATNINHLVKVYARAGICNNYISDEVIKYLDDIKDNDTVIIFWGHWSRVLFCVETDNPILESIKGDSLCYPSHSLSNNISWVRSKGLAQRAWSSIPRKFKKYNFPYYDYYFENYYFDHQHHLDNLKRILLIKLLLEDRGINYVFTAHDKYIDGIYPESLNAEKLLEKSNWFYPNGMGLIEYSNKNKWHISKQDQHFSISGHVNIATLLTDEIKKY